KSIQIDCSQIVAARIETSEEDFRTIFENLVSNAIQYTGANGTIEILAYIHRKHLTVIVQDTGIGIAAADLPKIFDRFWRSDKARSHRSGGNGL
ncbi:ATP-binding protein, partial [Acinetobacter baumannii]